MTGWQIVLSSDIEYLPLSGEASLVAAEPLVTLEIGYNGLPVLKMESARCTVFGGRDQLRRLVDCLNAADQIVGQERTAEYASRMAAAQVLLEMMAGMADVAQC